MPEGDGGYDRAGVQGSEGECGEGRDGEEGERQTSTNERVSTKDG